VDLKHSGLGIASFVTSLTTGVVMFVLIVIAGIMATAPGGFDETSPLAILLGMAIITLMLISLISIGLGIGGWLQKDRKSIFAILGVVIGTLTVAGTGILMIIGSTM